MHNICIKRTENMERIHKNKGNIQLFKNSIQNETGISNEYYE